MGRSALMLLVLPFLTPANGLGLADFSDDFEDGTINPDHWAYGGRPVSWSASAMGSWEWSHEEMVASDGYLQTRVVGPTSGYTYGGASWLLSKHDLNDGKSHLVDFTWQADVSDSNGNTFFIQVTDGFIAPFDVYPNEFYNQAAYLHSPAGIPYVEGTMDLYWGMDAIGTPIHGVQIPTDTGKRDWSVTIDPSGVARLYDGPGGSGTRLREESLNSDKEWHLRFMTADATSAGFPAGDNRLNLYRIEATSVPEPSTLVLLAMGALALTLGCWRRRRKA